MYSSSLKGGPVLEMNWGVQFNVFIFLCIYVSVLFISMYQEIYESFHPTILKQRMFIVIEMFIVCFGPQCKVDLLYVFYYSNRKFVLKNYFEKNYP